VVSLKLFIKKYQKNKPIHKTDIRSFDFCWSLLRTYKFFPIFVERIILQWLSFMIVELINKKINTIQFKSGYVGSMKTIAV